MAKAIVGFIGGPTSAQSRDSSTLRRRVADLEAEVMRLKVENDGLLKALREQVDHVTAADLREPVAGHR